MNEAGSLGLRHGHFCLKSCADYTRRVDDLKVDKEALEAKLVLFLSLFY